MGDQANTVRWNAVCIDCTPAQFEQTVAFYAGLLELEVADKEPRWAALRDPAGRMGITPLWWFTSTWSSAPRRCIWVRCSRRPNANT